MDTYRYKILYTHLFFKYAIVNATLNLVFYKLDILHMTEGLEHSIDMRSFNRFRNMLLPLLKFL